MKAAGPSPSSICRASMLATAPNGAVLALWTFWYRLWNRRGFHESFPFLLLDLSLP